MKGLLLHGDLGESYRYHLFPPRSSAEDLVSFRLGIYAFMLTF
jgi:hypothetical protein